MLPHAAQRLRASPAPTNNFLHSHLAPRRRPVVTVAGLDSFTGLSAFLQPEYAAVFSAVIAVSSVALNLYGGLLTERKRVELQREVERDRLYQAELEKQQGMIARYRGPMLEASIDLEQRIYHLITHTGEWYKPGVGEDSIDGMEVSTEEINYTLFTLGQFLGFVEVVRREGPRERSFLQAGNPQGTDTLATLIEGFRFVMCGGGTALQEWHADVEGEGVREHPGSRHRRPYQPGRSSARQAMPDNFNAMPLRLSRGVQRSIGSLMIVTPMGAARHYTLSYGEFCAKLDADQEFAKWFTLIRDDLLALLAGPSWQGEDAFQPTPEGTGAPHRWTRCLLVQQLLMDTIDLLDPDYRRVAGTRRTRLRPVTYGPLPNVADYQKTLTILSRSVDKYEGTEIPGGHFQALQNLARPAAPAFVPPWSISTTPEPMPSATTPEPAQPRK